jgi:hypothetical protein
LWEFSPRAARDGPSLPIDVTLCQEDRPMLAKPDFSSGQAQKQVLGLPAPDGPAAAARMAPRSDRWSASIADSLRAVADAWRFARLAQRATGTDNEGRPRYRFAPGLMERLYRRAFRKR